MRKQISNLKCREKQNNDKIDGRPMTDTVKLYVSASAFEKKVLPKSRDHY